MASDNVLTPKGAVRNKCRDCGQGSTKPCPADDCALYNHRTGKKGRVKLKTIRSYCLWCCNDQKHEIKLCTVTKCALWEYRLGKRPVRIPSLPVEVGIAVSFKDETARPISTTTQNIIDKESAL